MHNDKPTGHEPVSADVRTYADAADPGMALTDPGQADPVMHGSAGLPSGHRPASQHLVRSGRLWLPIFAVSLGLFIVCMMGCAIAALIPVGYFSGISATRHMVGMNVATALALPVSVALIILLMHQLLTARCSRARSGLGCDPRAEAP